MNETYMYSLLHVCLPAQKEKYIRDIHILFVLRRKAYMKKTVQEYSRDVQLFSAIHMSIKFSNLIFLKI